MTTVDDDPSDPVVATYNVFLKPSLPAHQRLLVLQYPNRVDKNAGVAGSAGASRDPTELRIKGKSGMVEVDVPLDYTAAYDRSKGMAWGAALASSTKAKAGGQPWPGRWLWCRRCPGRGEERAGWWRRKRWSRRSSDADSGRHDEQRGTPGYVNAGDWSEAVRQDRVLRLQTLGGMCPPPANAEAKWMIGVFDGGNLHMTPVSSLVHLRPQLHHIDAETEVDRVKHSGGDAAGGAGGAAGGRGGAAAAARAIHMTIKSAGTDGDEVVLETMADRLRAVQMEHWTRMKYVSDEDEHSWDVYNQALFLRDKTSATTAAPATTAEDKDDKGKKVATDATVATSAADGKLLASKVPSLLTGWSEEDMLQAISGMEPPAGTTTTTIPAPVEAKQEPKQEPRTTATPLHRVPGAPAAAPGSRARAPARRPGGSGRGAPAAHMEID